MVIDLLTAALAFSLSQIVLSVLLFVRNRHTWSVQEWLYGVFLLAVAGYLLTPVLADTPLALVMGSLQTLVPGTFWLFSAAIFDDHFKLRPWKLMLVALTVVLPAIGETAAHFGLFAPRLLFWTLPQALEFILMGLALWVVLGFWRDDLVQARRDLRLWFCGLNGLYIIALLLLREILFPGAPWLELWQYVPVGGMLLVTNALLLEYKTGLFHPPTASAATMGAQPYEASSLEQISMTEQSVAGAVQVISGAQLSDFDDSGAEYSSNAPGAHIDHRQATVGEPKEDVPQAVLLALQTLMDDENVYREMGLTIGQLAVRLDLPEYRLRRMINAGLGYRNFNDFLNTYRIREASERLTDPHYEHEAVLNIALDVGFRSLSSFNKAFKQSFGLTPTQYRSAPSGAEGAG